MAGNDRIFQGPCNCIGHPAEVHDDNGCTHVSGAGTLGEHHCPCRAHWITLAPVPEGLAGRHPSTQEKMRWLVPNPNLPAGAPADVSRSFWDFACGLVAKVKDGSQLTITLQRLIDAKDSAVRQAIADGGS